MNLKTILDMYSWEQIREELLHQYPDQKASIDGYRGVVASLRSITPVVHDLLLSVMWVTDDYDGTPYVDVSGVLKESEHPDHCLMFTEWELWLGSEISPESLLEFSPLEILVHCLWELTFVGYTQGEIRQQRDAIMDMAQDAREQLRQDVAKT